MKTIDRLEQFIESQYISKNSFDLKIEASNGYIGKQIKSHASIGSDVLEKIFSSFPELSPRWLLTGKGSMLLSAEEQQEGITAMGTPKTLEDVYQKLERIELLLAKSRKK